MNRPMSSTGLPPLCGVSSIARALGLSRARFYQLVRAGVFPYPIYDLRTRRPYFTVELQEICHQVRQTNVGYNGLPILFYSPRRTGDPMQKTSASAKKRKQPRPEPLYQELSEALLAMGIGDATSDRVKEAVNTLYPDKQVEEMDRGILIRHLYRFLRQGAST